MSSPNLSQVSPTNASGQPAPPAGAVLAVSATFTAEPVQDALAFWMEELGFACKLKFAPYHQVFQQLLDPSSLLARNRDGINVVLARLEDWARFHESVDPERLEENVRHFVSCVQAAAASFASPLIVCLCPDSPGFLGDPERAAFVRRMEELAECSLRGLGAVHLIMPAQLNDLYPVRDYYDPHGDELGHVPYTPLFFAALGTMLARKIAALRTPPFKAVALDCDDTLWQGICGEDGPQGVVLDPPRRALQEFMRSRLESGMLLCLCSKNNEEDVIETFRANPHMPLRLEDFVARQINWEAKPVNLAALADSLQLGLDSFILIDDNPKECAEVQAEAPEVLTVPLPPDPAEIPEFLKHVWAFDRARITAEDRNRAALYSQQMERARLERQASTLEEFIASLNLQVRIAPMSAEQLRRVSQLTQRTNQMNFTTVRRAESDIQALLNSGAECLTVEVTDRFGSYGLCGVMIFTNGPEAIALDTFLLSCRALGRGVEHRMLARLGEIAAERGLARVDAPFVPTQRNRPARQFLESAGAQFIEPRENGAVFRFPADYAKRISYKPSSAPPKPAGAPAAERSQGPAEAPPRIDYRRIAAELRDPARILDEVRARLRESAVPPEAAAEPRTGLEEQLAKLWAELLNRPAVGIHDNFFDLGGHSLLAVQLLSRVRQEFGIELSLEIVYGGAFTVAELAKAIELQQIEQAGADRYSAILEELEGLSDEEVRALLAEEQGEPQDGNPR